MKSGNLNFLEPSGALQACNGLLYLLPFIFDLAQFFLEWEMFRTKVVEKIKTHILCSVISFRKSCRLWDNGEKYCSTWQVTEDNMAHAHCMLDTYGYRHTLIICNINFPLQQWLYERASLLRYAYIVRLFVICRSISPSCWMQTSCLDQSIAPHNQ
jgi:hypothetical protein